MRVDFVDISDVYDVIDLLIKVKVGLVFNDDILVILFEVYIRVKLIDLVGEVNNEIYIFYLVFINLNKVILIRVWISVVFVKFGFDEGRVYLRLIV